MKQIMNGCRTAFYALDITVVSIFVFFATHYWWTYHPMWSYLFFILYPLLLRLNISFMLYRRKWAVMSIVMAFVLGFICVEARWLEYATEKMTRIGFLLYKVGVDGVLDRTSAYDIGEGYGDGIYLIACAWLLILPILVLIVRFLRLMTKHMFQKRRLPLKKIFSGDIFTPRSFIPDWKLSHLLQDRSARVVTLFLLLSVVASYAGEGMGYLPAVISVIGLPLLVMCFVNRLHNATAKYMELLFVLLGSILFWNAQFNIDFARLGLLLVSAVLIGLACVVMYKEIKNGWLSLVVFFFIAFVLPSMSIGYNQYAVMDAARVGAYRTYVGMKGLMYVRIDDKYGLRDRYGIIVPCQYDDIKPCWENYKYVILENGSDKCLYNLWEHKKVVRNITLNTDWQKKTESLMHKAIDEQQFDFGQVLVMDAETGYLKVMASVGASKSQEGLTYKNPWECSFHTGLIRPFSCLAALQPGKVELCDSVGTSNLLFSKDNTNRMVKKSFGKDADSLFIYLKKYNYDKTIRLNDELLEPVVNIKSQIKGKYSGDIFALANGYGTRVTALQVVDMYRLLVPSNEMKLYYTEGERNYMDLIPNTEGVNIVQEALSLDDDNLPVLKNLPFGHIQLTGYASTDRQKDASDSIDTSICTGFCGNFKIQGKTYIVYVMFERAEMPCDNSRLQIVLPELIEYFYN